LAEVQAVRQAVLKGVVAAGIVLLAVFADAHTVHSRRVPRDLDLFQKEHATLHSRFAQAIEDLAKQNEAWPEEARRLRDLMRPVSSQTIRFAPLPRKVRPDLPLDIPEADRFRESQLRKHQGEYAKGLYLLSRRALHAGHLGYAYDLVYETAIQDPDHTAARKILGFERLGDEWMSPFEAEKKRKQQVWHPQFGWLAEKDVPRYEKGERLYSGVRWVSVAKEAELRRDFKDAWQITTEHFKVKTNHSLERGVELASRLEDFYGLCRQTLAGFFFSPEQLQLLFDGKSEAGQRKPRPLEVNYYRSREEYLAVLSKMTNQPVEITKGMYFPTPGPGVAYFYYDPKESNDSTLFHEATHLLLSGYRPQAGVVAQRSNFWIVEGIACYMESFHRDQGELSVGNPANDRINAAQHHLLQDNYYVPLREFSSMGMQAFQTDKEIRKNYSQAAALTHFFLHYEGGKYRDALIEHLSQIYSPQQRVRQDPESLSSLVDVAEEQLDHEYADYLKKLDTRTVQPAVAEPVAP
jgi:hypothetical protein